MENFLEGRFDLVVLAFNDPEQIHHGVALKFHLSIAD